MMAGKMTFAVSGLKEFSAGLEELSKAAQKGVLRRTLLKAGEPLRDRAAQLAPKGDTGDLSGSIALSAKTVAETDAGKKAYAAAKKAGGSNQQAVAAMRDARRSSKASGDTFAQVFVGPARGGKRRAIKAIVQELGSVKQAPQPYLRPALSETKDRVVAGIGRELGTEISKAAARAARRAAKKAGK